MVKKKILRDNKRSMRKLASDLGISPTSMRRIVKLEMGFCSHKIRPDHMLTEKVKVTRYEKRNSIDDSDWASAHGAKTTVELCRQQFPDFWGKDIWPSN
uniref:HTH_Tnp_Tc3_1 domain-containing protein n=1 Tax=Heterorhabditis bacteriophora TaxID=37862 RepID=A0A1I7XGQ5_HETBA